MAIKIKSTKDITSDGANILIYGESGVGKTYLIKDLKNSIVVSADKGLLTLKKFDIPYIDVNNMQDINDAYELVKKSNYDHIVLDSLTEIAESVMFELKEKKLDGTARKDKRAAYGDLADLFGVMIRKFRDIRGKNTIFICKMKYIYELSPSGEEILIGYGPMIPGKVLPHGIPYLTDEVFAYIKDRKGRFFLTEGDRKYPAKDRSQALEAKEYEPNLQSIIDRVLENSKETKPEINPEIKRKENGRVTRCI